MFRQPWLKTLPVSYLSNISTSEKLLVSMARLLDPRGSIIRPPCWTAASLCNLLVNISKMPNAEMRARSSYMEKLTPGSGGCCNSKKPLEQSGSSMNRFTCICCMHQFFSPWLLAINHVIISMVPYQEWLHAFQWDSIIPQPLTTKCLAAKALCR